MSKSTMVKKRAQYSAEALDTAVDQVIEGRPTKEVSQDTGIAYSTLRKDVVAKANGDTYEPKRRGPPPLLPVDAEERLTEWIVGRQQVGPPRGASNDSCNVFLIKARNSVDVTDVHMLFGTMAKLIIERAYGLSRQ
ncbi:hypothetical protein PHMEG_0003734 [Phytophthora megakarya]|uniref:HTH psq-type domain-containing protein n=1 Tax=Phytophthora megakarya TaxID=4795 RepID=A0A225WVF9_9STRA|nr:hypothetical protein PHMEG_0003734 [Phytophthora megakarya]